MKVTTLIALALGLGAFTVIAQDQSGGPGGPPGHAVTVIDSAALLPPSQS